MKPTRFDACIVIFLSIVAGCTPGAKKAKYTVDQYLADRSLMNKTVEECGNNPGELRNDPDCINAIAAARQDGYGSLRKLPGVLGPAATTDKSAMPRN